MMKVSHTHGRLLVIFNFYETVIQNLSGVRTCNIKGIKISVIDIPDMNKTASESCQQCLQAFIYKAYALNHQ